MNTRQRIEDYIREQGDHGATADECEAASDINPKSCSARIHELRLRKVIESGNRMRATRKGGRAVVLVWRNK